MGEPDSTLLGDWDAVLYAHHDDQGFHRFLKGTAVLDDVVALLRSVGSPDDHPRHHVGPLVLVDGRHSEAEFSTDRAKHVFPEWRFESEQLLEGLAVLDPAIARRHWQRPDPPAQPRPAGGRGHRSLRSWIETDDRRLHYGFTGGNPEWVDYPSAEVVESEQALAVIPVVVDHGPSGPRHAIGYGREVVVHLQKPLDPRVLVNRDASAVPVTD